MDTDTKQEGEGIVAEVGAQSEPTALDIIRTETVLSKLPMHNLSKKGRIDIEIKILGPNGEINLSWEVSYNEKYGQARQLAYKVDTIIVDDRIDKAPRPLPTRMCLGSLNQIAAELGLLTNHGTTNKNLKKALRQNALLGITAKLTYEGKDKIERTLDTTFTRYSIIFTGEKFPDGTKADAVYIELNPTYREVLNNAKDRPTDREYKKRLPPTSQRWYEIASYKIYAALRFNHPVAKLPYSEFCMFSAQQRYFDYDHFKKQMYKIHLLHVKSGYISKVHYQEATDSEGKRDWIMCYVPGPKAQAEFAAAHRGHKSATVEFQPSEAGERSPRRSGPRPRRSKLEPVQESAVIPDVNIAEQPAAAADTSINQEFLSALVSRGIAESAARELLSKLKPDQQVIDQLEWGESQVRKNPDTYKNPAGFYIYLIRENLTVPANFETSRKRAAREAEVRLRAEKERLQREYELYRGTEIDRYITEHSDEFAAVKENKAKDFIERYGNDPMFNRFATIDARVEIGKKVSVLTFDEFVRAEKAIAATQLSNVQDSKNDLDQTIAQQSAEPVGEEQLSTPEPHNAEMQLEALAPKPDSETTL